MAGARFSSLFKRDNVPNKTVEEVVAEKAANDKLKAADKEAFLADMSKIESNSGQNTNHKTMNEGLHAGQHAVGQYGFMPKTIKEMANKMRMDDDVPPALNAANSAGADEQEMADFVAQNPDLEQAVADKMYSHLRNRFNNDEEKMNYSWEQGHNLSPEGITPEKIEANPRTEKFRKLRSKLNK